MSSLAFFSYSRLDAEFVLQLAKDLRAAGSAVWLDQLDIKAGEHWDTAVEMALSRSPVMLVVLSPSSVESHNVMDEVSFALDEKKPVIPVLYRDCKIPMRLRRMQYIDFRGEYEQSLIRLLENLGHLAPAEAARSRNKADAPEIAAQPEPTPVSSNGHTAADTQPKRESARADDAYVPSRTPTFEHVRIEPSAPASLRKYMIAGGAAAVVLIVVIILAISSSNYSNSTPTVTTGTSNNTAAGTDSSSPATSGTNIRKGQISLASSVPAARGPNLREWLVGFIVAFSGPPVGKLQPYFADTVSPYFRMSTANWNEIAQDKELYYKRFPEIHYTLVGEPVYSNVGREACTLSFDLQHTEVRFDRKNVSGMSHVTMNLRNIDGQWKIAGIQ